MRQIRSAQGKINPAVETRKTRRKPCIPTARRRLEYDKSYCEAALRGAALLLFAADECEQGCYALSDAVDAVRCELTGSWRGMQPGRETVMEDSLQLTISNSISYHFSYIRLLSHADRRDGSDIKSAFMMPGEVMRRTEIFGTGATIFVDALLPRGADGIFLPGEIHIRRTSPLRLI